MNNQICKQSAGAFLFLLGLTLLSPAATAQDFTVYVGGINPGTLGSNSAPILLDGSAVWGFRLSTSLVPQLGLEHTLAFSSDFLFPKGLPSIGDAKGIIYNSNLILNLPLGNSVPYVTAGLGLIRQYGSSNLPVGTRFTLNYGGGIKFKGLSGPFGLRIDARGYSAQGFFGRNLNIFELSGGLLISF